MDHSIKACWHAQIDRAAQNEMDVKPAIERTHETKRKKEDDKKSTHTHTNTHTLTQLHTN